MRKIILSLLSLILMAAAPFTQEVDLPEGVLPEYSADRSELTVGDVILVTLSVQHPQDSRLIIEPLEDHWGEFEVLSQSQPEVSPNKDDSQNTRVEYRLTLFAPGEYQTPALELNYLDPQTEIQVITLPPLSFTVNSVLVEGDEQLRDIKPQASLRLIPLWLQILFGLLLLAGLIWLIRWLLRKRNSKTTQEPQQTPDPRPAHIIALDELQRIENLELPQQNKLKEHYSLLTDCLRAYLENGLGIPALERTTREIRHSLNSSKILAGARRQLLAIFNEGDLVKFARFNPGAENAREMLSNARTLVQNSAPQPHHENAEETKA